MEDHVSEMDAVAQGLTLPSQAEQGAGESASATKSETPVRLADGDGAETNGASEPRRTTYRVRPAIDRTRYLSTREAADLLGVNRATVINWARQGKFGGFQYGVRGIYRFDREELQEFIGRSRIPFGAASSVQPTADR